ncbi:MAG: PEGA domain-containing protein [Trueperaceae bacterium]|nr:PEGA domain-containing protein [Trueperaceae bacterium]
MLRLRSNPSSFARHAGLRLAVVVTALSLFAAAVAQGPVLSPRSIVVNPIPGFEVDVWLDKDPSGRDAPAYRVGENLEISVRPSADAYVYLFSLAADGEVVQVLPNRYDADGSNNFVSGGTVRTFPPGGARYTFNVAPPQGLAKVMAVASRRPLDVSTLASFRSENDFATSNIGEDAFARALRIIVTPIPSTDWVSATALYYVGTRPQVGAYGTLRIDSDPRRGEVYVDRTFVGYTPLDYDLRPGMYDVEVVAGGRSGSERVQIRPDRVSDVFLSLRPVVQQGTASFTSSPSGAEVFVDGRRVGTTDTGRVTFDTGSYVAEFRRDGYTVQSVRFDVRANGDTRVAATLQALTGTLEIQANVGGARVFLDGREVGVIASGSGRLTVRDLPAGVRELVLLAPGYRAVVQDVRIEAGRTSSVTLRMVRP